MKHYALLIITLLFLFQSYAWSETTTNANKQRPKIIAVFDEVERTLSAQELTEALLKDLGRRVNAQKVSIIACTNEAKSDLKKVTDDLKSLGDKTEGEPSEIAKKRASLSDEVTRIEQKNANCQLLSLRADELLEQIANLTKNIVTERLFSKGPNIVQLILENWNKPEEWLEALRTSFARNSGLTQITITERVMIIVAIIFVAIVSTLIRKKWRARIIAKPPRKSFGGQFNVAFTSTLSHYLVHISVSITAAVTIFLATYDYHPIPFTNVVAYGLPAYFIFVAVIRIFLSPRRPAERFLNIEPSVSKSLARRLGILALLSFLGYLLFATLLVQSLPEPTIQLARAAFFAVLVLNLLWALWLLGQIEWFANIRFLRFGLALLLIAILIAEWLGYRNLSIATFRAVFGTAALFGFISLLSRILRESYDGLESGRYQWQRRVRTTLRLKGNDPIPGMAWVRALTAIVLWGTFALVTLRIFGMSDTALQQLNLYLVDGFTVGSVHLIPIRFVFALLSFILLVTFSQWFSTQMERNWLNKTRMERGAREAVVTISGYVGIAIALLVGLGIAGLNFGNLAIIAGALSVGIGFGLQNVVNNFVSGLILLFERPVKTGDWIVVGNTEGFVRRIRIRSTQIQTFDQADVIVPNSELISNQVTNWMLYDPRGRIRIPIGVAYGSDTELVRTILLSLAEQHDKVINDMSNLKPKVLFMAFGDSSLNFELRCFIRNIDTRLDVISDINFAIDAEFRKHKIQIPFPQRDLHLIPPPPTDDPPKPPPNTP